ncbi:MAG: hypothetical protein M0Z95_08755, partial [Actinomycetota bacterium]|nr:hypothetical protein [Actinomycetota bacterium]
MTVARSRALIGAAALVAAAFTGAVMAPGPAGSSSRHATHHSVHKSAKKNKDTKRRSASTTSSSLLADALRAAHARSSVHFVATSTVPRTISEYLTDLEARLRASRAAGIPSRATVTDRCQRHQATAFLGLDEAPPRLMTEPVATAASRSKEQSPAVRAWAVFLSPPLA